MIYNTVCNVAMKITKVLASNNRVAHIQDLRPILQRSSLNTDPRFQYLHIAALLRFFEYHLLALDVCLNNSLFTSVTH